MNAMQWYNALAKPSWAPPPWIFSPVWSALYIIIALTFGVVFLKYFQKKLPGKVALPFLLNLIVNIIYSPIQFGLKDNLLGAIDIVLILSTLIWALLVLPRGASAKWGRWVALANLPYLLWVSFATILQLTITWMNF